jgi:hypothetical protein
VENATRTHVLAISTVRVLMTRSGVEPRAMEAESYVPGVFAV